MFTGGINRDELKEILSGGDDENSLTDDDIDFIFMKMDLDGDKMISEDGQYIHVYVCGLLYFFLVLRDQ